MGEIIPIGREHIRDPLLREKLLFDTFQDPALVRGIAINLLDEVNARRQALHTIFWSTLDPQTQRICGDVYAEWGGVVEDA